MVGFLIIFEIIFFLVGSDHSCCSNSAILNLKSITFFSSRPLPNYERR